jgi:hypothetical protein
MGRTLGAAVVTVALVGWIVSPCGAQVSTATLTVATEVGDGTPLSGVAVVATNRDTGFERRAMTDELGRALLQGMAPGAYEVTAELQGFEAAMAPDCVLRVGQTVNLRLTLRPRVEETVEVAGAAPLVDVERHEAATNVVPEQIQQLPVIDRKFERLAFITPGVQADRVDYFDRSGAPVIGAAATGAQATMLLDGVELTDPNTGLARQRISQDAVREFRVSRQGFSAEIGGSASGAITIVTRTGGNQPRGSFYGFYRADALRAQGALELEDADFTRYQLGLTLGGPLVRDRTHYLLSLEHLDENKLAYVRPGGSLGYLAADVPAPVELTTLLASLDHRFAPSSTGSARLIWERYRQGNYDVGGVRDESSGWSFVRDAWTLLLGHSWVIGGDRLNELGAQLGSREIPFPANSETVGEWFSLGASLQTGGTFLGGDGLLEGDFAEFRETFSWQPGDGRHRLRAGLRWMHLEQSYREDRFGFGLLVYLDDNGLFPVQYLYGTGSSHVEQSSDLWGAFLQDDWRVSESLTIGLGLRYDLDVGGNNPDFQHPLVSNARGVDTDNLQPRLSFSWDLSGEGRTVIRGGVGWFTGLARGLGGLYELMFNGITGRTLLRNVSVIDLGIWLDPSDPANSGVPLAPDIWLLDDEAPSPESTQAGLGLSQRLGDTGLSLEVDAIWVEGRKEIAVQDTNWRGNDDPCQSDPFPGSACRIEPDYTRVERYTNRGRSRYRALTVGVNGVLAGGHLLTAALTVADKKNIADDPGDIYNEPSDPADLEAEWGRAVTDERVRLVVTGIFNLPWRLTVAPIYEYGSGQPWNQRLGYDDNSDSYFTDRAPGVDRNEQDGPSFSQLSLRLSKALRVGPGDLELIVEVFNLLNTTNYDVSSVLDTETIWDPTVFNYVPNPDLGTYTATLPPREIQLGLRYSF